MSIALAFPCEWSETGEFNDGEAQVLDTEGNLYIINRWGNIIIFSIVLLSFCKQILNI